ncbi:MAG TPA: protein kinase [Kofleriaceae bacterium]|nr:protein kinase [Kofleriaceae bacterium]
MLPDATPRPVVILIVDDDALLPKAIASLLARDDRRIVVSHDPNEALAILDREPVDLVLTDRRMPQMSGHELAEAIHRRHPDIPCAILTGDPSLDSALEAINKGQVFRYLTKPCETDELEAAVTAGLALRAERQAAAARDADVTAPVTPPEIGKYRVIAQLGEGGMGRVFKGYHVVLQRLVAIKILHGTVARDPRAMARFEREARAAVRARHPRIVETLDFGRLPDGRPYLVMELVEGETLRARLHRAPMTPIDAVHVARGVAEGLAAAHAVDVIHRDLKPSNVFVDDQLEVKLGDFGAAKILDPSGENITGGDVTIGTPHYMAPEQILGEPVDGRTDVYALGCMLYRMLAGAPPFAGPDTRTVLAQHLHADPPVPTSAKGPLPAAVTDIVASAMAKDPARRPQSALELLAALERAAMALDDQAHPG